MSITFKNPAFGSSVSLVTNTITRVTAGGKTNQSRFWFNFRRYHWIFNNLNKTQLTAFLAWAITNAGLVVSLVDELGHTLTGVIDSEISYQQSADDDCDGLYNLEFVFIGESL